MDESNPGRGVAGLSESMTWLMQNTVDDHGRALTSESVAYHVQRRGVSCSAAYVASLRSGRRRSPSAELLVALGDAVGVMVEYFTDADVRARIQADGPMSVQERREAGEVAIYVMRHLSAPQRRDLLAQLMWADTPTSETTGLILPR